MQTFFDRLMTTRVVQKWHNPGRPPQPGDELTMREMQVLHFHAIGYTQAEVGERLGITTFGVDAHVRKIKLKLSAKNMTHAVYRACIKGILK